MVQVWPLGHSLSTTALMDNTAKHTHMDRHTHHPVKDNMKIPWPHKHIFRKLILTLNGDMTLIMHIHTKRDVKVFQRLGARMFLLLLNESHMVNLWLTQRHILFWKKKKFNSYEECWFGGGLVSNLITLEIFILSNYSIKVIPQVFMKFTDQATKKSITNLTQLLNYNMQFSPED